MSNRDANVEKLYDVYKDVPYPIESYGICIRKRCHGYGVLGDGYCIRCWDKGYNTKDKQAQSS